MDAPMRTWCATLLPIDRELPHRTNERVEIVLPTCAKLSTEIAEPMRAKERTETVEPMVL